MGYATDSPYTVVCKVIATHNSVSLTRFQYQTPDISIIINSKN